MHMLQLEMWPPETRCTCNLEIHFLVSNLDGRKKLNIWAYAEFQGASVRCPLVLSNVNIYTWKFDTRHISPYSNNFNSLRACTFGISAQKPTVNFLWNSGLKGIWPWYITYSDYKEIVRRDLEIIGLTALSSLGSGGMIVQALNNKKKHRKLSTEGCRDSAVETTGSGGCKPIRGAHRSLPTETSCENSEVEAKR